MSEEDNKRLVTRWYNELFNQRKLNVADEIIARGAVMNGEPDFPNPQMGPAGYKALVNHWTGRFPQAKITITNQTVVGNKVTTRWTAKAHPEDVDEMKGEDTWTIQDGRIIGNECKREHSPF